VYLNPFNRLPHVPKPRMTICILADAADIDRAKQIDLEYQSVDDLKKWVEHFLKRYLILRIYSHLLATDSTKIRNKSKSSRKNTTPLFHPKLSLNKSLVCSDLVSPKVDPSTLSLLPLLNTHSFHLAGKFPTPVTHSDDLNGKITEVKSTIKFQLKKVLCLGVAVGHVEMTDDQLVANIMLAINFLISLLKKK
jgi:large subunit ribosomal protein L10Ae